MCGNPRPASFAAFLGSYRQLSGTVSSPGLEEALGASAAAGDVRDSPEAMALVREYLHLKGITLAPGSAELVGLLNEVPAEQLNRANVDFRNCVGLSREQLLNARNLGCISPCIARIVLASLAQLELVLPADSVVLGPLEGTFRGQRGAISWLHIDEHRTSDVYVEQALFPVLRSELCREAANAQVDSIVFQHYNEFRARTEQLYPELILPAPSACNADFRGANGSSVIDDNLRSFTKRVMAAVADYHRGGGRAAEDELVFDIVNVWIPKADKQLALLPMPKLGGTLFQHGTRPSVEEVEAAGLRHEFLAFGRGVSVVFFGRHVLHQAAEGPEFARCDHGSMETRYLILTPRRSAHRFSSLRRTPSTAMARGPVPQAGELAVGGPAADAAKEAAGAEVSPRRKSHAGDAVLLDEEPHLAWYLSLWET